MPLAASTTSLLDKVGSYAGLASVLGLALLALLYFTQAREVKRLREWAAGAAERETDDARAARDAALAAQRRVTGSRSAVRPTGSGPPAASAAGAAAAARAQAPGQAPAAARAQGPAAARAQAPAGPLTTRAAGSTPASAAGSEPSGAVAAPAGASGASPPAAEPTGAGSAAVPADEAASQAPGEPTVVHPTVPQTDTPSPAAVPVAAGSTAAADSSAAAGSPSGAGPGTAAGRSAGAATAERTVDAPPAAVPRTGAAPRAAAVPRTGAAPRAAAVPRTGAAPRAGAAPRGAAALRTSPASRPAAAATRGRDSNQAAVPRRGSGRERLPPRALALLAGVAALVAVVVVIAITQLSAGGSHTRVAGAPVASTGSSAGAQPGRHRAGAPAAGGGVDHSTVTVAVLNGTTTPGLAKQVLDQLLKLGFKGGPTANAATQQLAATQVAYATGDRAAARAVAQSLGLPASAVTSADAGVRALAGPGAQVVVTVGGDHATHP